MAQVITVTRKGPWFDRLPKEHVRRVADKVMQEVMEAGEARLNTILRPRPAGVFLSLEQAGRARYSTGNYRRNLNSRMEAGEGILSDGGVIYGPWLEGTSSRNQTTRFKGYFSFRQTGQWMQKQVRKIGQRVASRYMGQVG